jgi:ComF family protein
VIILSNSELNKIIKIIFDFIFPRICLSCNTKLNLDESVICNSCKNTIKIVPQEFLKLEYLKKFHNDLIIDDFESCFLFEKEKVLQKVLHSYKYENKIYVGKFLGDLIYSNLEKFIKAWDGDLIIPVPLHSLKKAERGYNQSYYIAKQVAKRLEIPIDKKLLKRRRYTQSQTKMNLIERKENVKNAFMLKDKKKIFGKKIILVDDVITTGATIGECAKVLKENGAIKIFALSVAIPIDHILFGAETPNIDSPFLNTI